MSRISESQLVNGSWVPSFYGYDGHGSARFLANTAGTVTDTYTYDAFGAQIATTGTTPNPYLYSGERFDSFLNLYDLRARYYNMLTGRFETMDPAAGKILDPGTLHKYVYAKSNPTNFSDPTGRGVVENLSIRAWIFTEITVPAYIQEIGALKLIGSAGGLAGLAAAAVCDYLDSAEKIKSASETGSEPTVTAPGLYCNEQPHPAPGGPGEPEPPELPPPSPQPIGPWSQ